MFCRCLIDVLFLENHVSKIITDKEVATNEINILNFCYNMDYVYFKMSFFGSCISDV